MHGANAFFYEKWVKRIVNSNLLGSFLKHLGGLTRIRIKIINNKEEFFMNQGKGCIKCGGTDAGQKEVAMTGTGLSKMFDIQHNRFIVVYCKNCGYSEFYNKDASAASNILDLFFG